MINRLMLAIATAAMALTPHAASAQIKWDMATALPLSNFLTANQQRFSENVRQASGGKLIITVHPAASLFKQGEIKRAVQTNQAQLGELLLGVLSNEDPVFGVDNTLFIATGYDAAKKLDAAARPFLEKALAGQGLKLLYTIPWPPQGIYANREITSAKDFQGLKWRAYSPQTARFAELVKAQPVTVPAAELTEALAGGRVNSMMTSAASGVDAKAWENLKYFYDVQAGLPKQFVFVNKAAFDSLAAELQESVLREAAKAEDEGWTASKDVARKTLDELRQRGMTVSSPTEQLQNELAAIGQVMAEEWSKSAGQTGREILATFAK